MDPALEKQRLKMLKSIMSFVRDEDGMEMVEWTIVAIVFAVAAAIFWGDLGTAIDGALGQVEDEISGS
jgi:Flp pilus assembly pilin Flp